MKYRAYKKVPRQHQYCAANFAQNMFRNMIFGYRNLDRFDMIFFYSFVS